MSFVFESRKFQEQKEFLACMPHLLFLPSVAWEVCSRWPRSELCGYCRHSCREGFSRRKRKFAVESSDGRFGTPYCSSSVKRKQFIFSGWRQESKDDLGNFVSRSSQEIPPYFPMGQSSTDTSRHHAVYRSAHEHGTTRNA